jgi:hypothetical protein
MAGTSIVTADLPSYSANDTKLRSASDTAPCTLASYLRTVLQAVMQSHSSSPSASPPARAATSLANLQTAVSKQYTQWKWQK